MPNPKPVGKFKLFWRFVFFVRPVETRRFSFRSRGADSVAVAYREDALWLFHKAKNRWVLVDRQRVDFDVSPQGSVTYRQDYAEFNNGYLIAKAKEPHTVTEFLKPYNAPTYTLNNEEYDIEHGDIPGHGNAPFCTNPENDCLSNDGVFIEAEVSIESLPSDVDHTLHRLPIFWMENNNRDYGIFEIQQRDDRSLGTVIGGEEYIIGEKPSCPGHKQATFYIDKSNPQRQRDAIVDGFHRLQLTEIEGCFQMTVDSIPIVSFKNSQPKLRIDPGRIQPKTRHAFPTNPDLFYIGRYKNVKLKNGRIRRIVFDPTNPCWSCPTGA